MAAASEEFERRVGRRPLTVELVKLVGKRSLPTPAQTAEAVAEAEQVEAAVLAELAELAEARVGDEDPSDDEADEK